MTISYHYGDEDSFRTNILILQTGDQFYLFSDGFTDQFGGPERKKIQLQAVQGAPAIHK